METGVVAVTETFTQDFEHVPCFLFLTVFRCGLTPQSLWHLQHQLHRKMTKKGLLCWSYCRPCTQLSECVACLFKGCIETDGRGAGEKGEEGSECVACDAAVHARNCVNVLLVWLRGAFRQVAEEQGRKEKKGVSALLAMLPSMHATV